MTLQDHVVSDKGVELDPKKTENVKNFKKTVTRIYIGSFLELAGY